MRVNEEILMISRRVLKLFCLFAFGGALTGLRPDAQQLNDPEFQFKPKKPAYQSGSGPRVCIDAAHNNRHTMDGLFAPFAAILAADGYRLSSLREPFSKTALSSCEVLVIGNAHAAANRKGSDWPYPHASAFSRDEIDTVLLWIRAGGRLLLFADHSPAAGEAADLAVLLGVATLDAWSYNSHQGISPEILRRADGLFGKHSILEGRDATERIHSLAMYGAGAFFPSVQFTPLIRFGKHSTGWIHMGDSGQNLKDIREEEWPRYRLERWVLAAAREWSRGRIVALGDVTACTAQIQGPDKHPVGMNEPVQQQNAQFCLNVVRWLTGALDRPTTQ